MAYQLFGIPALSSTCCEANDQLQEARSLQIGLLRKCETVVVISG